MEYINEQKAYCDLVQETALLKQLNCLLNKLEDLFKNLDESVLTEEEEDLYDEVYDIYSQSFAERDFHILVRSEESGLDCS